MHLCQLIYILNLTKLLELSFIGNSQRLTVPSLEQVFNETLSLIEFLNWTLSRIVIVELSDKNIEKK